MSKEKQYTINVNLKFTNLISAETEKKAIDMVKDSFKDDFNIDLEDKEIKVIK